MTTATDHIRPAGSLVWWTTQFGEWRQGTVESYDATRGEYEIASTNGRVIVPRADLLPC